MNGRYEEIFVEPDDKCELRKNKREVRNKREILFLTNNNKKENITRKFSEDETRVN